MANHASAIKRLRASETKRVRNHYQEKTLRSSVKKLRNSTAKSEATPLYNKVASMLDKLVKKNILHKNKAGNLKSSLSKKIKTLA